MIDRVSEPRTEAIVAAEWWANILRVNDVMHDAGDALTSAMLRWARDNESVNESFDPRMVEEFELELRSRIEQMIDDRPWNEEKPYLGHRGISCDYGPHPILHDAAGSVGMEISRTTFPSKTTMWIDPARVYVSVGYQGDIETVWEAGEYLSEITEIVSDWVRVVEHPNNDMMYEYEPKVFPTYDGYVIRVYGDYDESAYGPEFTEFTVEHDQLDNGVASALQEVYNDVVAWQSDE